MILIKSSHLYAIFSFYVSFFTCGICLSMVKVVRSTALAMSSKASSSFQLRLSIQDKTLQLPQDLSEFLGVLLGNKWLAHLKLKLPASLAPQGGLSVLGAVYWPGCAVPAALERGGVLTAAQAQMQTREDAFLSLEAQRRRDSVWALFDNLRRCVDHKLGGMF